MAGPLFGKGGWLNRRDTGAEALAQQIRALDDDMLMAAFHHPDQPAATRQACAAELRERNHLRESIEGWLPSAASLTVPRSLPAGLSVSQYQLTARIRMFVIELAWLCATTGLLSLVLPYLLGPFHSATGVSPFVVLRIPFIAQLVLVLSLIVLFVSRERGVRLAARAVAVFCGLALLGHSMSYAAWSYRSQDRIVFVLLQTLAAATVLACIAGFVVRRGMVRLLLLRPFGEAQMTAALKRVVRDRLAPLGYVYTLSDRNYRPSTTMSLMAFFGQVRHVLAPILRPSLRLATVSDESSFRDLLVALSPGFEISAKSAYAGGQAFNIRSTDNWWKRCIDVMIHSTEIIVMDVSRVSTGSTWEIVQMRRRALLDKCVFIVQEQYQQDGAQLLRELLPGGSMPRIHAFRSTGEFLDLQAFQAAIDERLERALAHTAPASA
jgi:hypothetical protein